MNIALNLCTAAALGPVRDSDGQTATLAVAIQSKGVARVPASSLETPGSGRDKINGTYL